MKTKKTGDRLSIARLDPVAHDHLSHDHFDQLNIVNGGEVWGDLQFLIPYREKVRKLATIGAFEAFNGLDQLTELVELNLSDQVPSPVFDFSPLAKLQYCSLKWSSKMDGHAFFSLPDLRRLSIYLYKAADCSEIGLSKTLRVLTLRYGRVGSLRGIGGCSSLEELRLLNVQGLTTLDGLEDCPVLKTFEIDKGAVAGDVSGTLQNLESLEEVHLYSEKVELANLNWLVSNPGMRILRAGSKVRHIDWHVLFAAPKLYDIVIGHMPGSLPADEEISAIARQYGKTIREIEHSGTRRSPWICINFTEPTAGSQKSDAA